MTYFAPEYKREIQKTDSNKVNRKKGNLKLALIAEIRRIRTRYECNRVGFSNDLELELLASDNSFTTPSRFIVVAYKRGVLPL